MTHPDLEHPLVAVAVIEARQQLRVERRDFGVTELAVRRGLDLAAQLRRHRLHAVTDAEHGNFELEHRLRHSRRVFYVDRLGAA